MSNLHKLTMGILWGAVYRAAGLPFALAPLVLAAAGCWSEVQYEPEKEPVPDPSTPAAPAADEASPPSTPPSQPEPSPPLPVEEEAALPTLPANASEPPAEEPTPPTEDTSAKPAEDKLTFEELFGTADSDSDEKSPTESPPTDQTSDLPAADLAPVTQDPSQELMPWERETASQATTPALGDRYAAPQPSTEVAAPTIPSETNLYAPPATPDPTADEPPPSLDEPPLEPPSEVPPLADEPPTNLLPFEKPTDPILEESTPEEPQPAASEPMVDTPDQSASVGEADTPLLPADPLAEFAPPMPETDASESPEPIKIDPTNTREMAWLLGGKWSLMILGEHEGAPETERLKWFDQCQALAKALGVDLPKTPPSAASRPTAAFIENMLVAGRELAAAIGSKHGADEMALFEAAAKSNLPLVLVDSRPDLLPAIARSVAAAAQRAKLPENLTQPFVKALTSSTSPEQIEQTIYDFHRAVEVQLAQ